MVQQLDAVGGRMAGEHAAAARAKGCEVAGNWNSVVTSAVAFSWWSFSWPGWPIGHLLPQCKIVTL